QESGYSPRWPLAAMKEFDVLSVFRQIRPRLERVRGGPIARACFEKMSNHVFPKLDLLWLRRIGHVTVLPRCERGGGIRPCAGQGIDRGRQTIDRCRQRCGTPTKSRRVWRARS